jgi:Methylase involved in ubiquinone/menaquinone biosynthesis
MLPRMDSEEAEKVFDQYAEPYRDWWGPILEPSAVRLLERVSPPAGDEATFDLLDVGTGTGALALAVLERWPGSRVTGIDPSSRMLDVAADRARLQWSGPPGRLRLVVATADRLPLADQSMDLVVSSFVIQLVPKRAAMLREVRRVLRPAGAVAIVTWQDDDLLFEPDELFADVVRELRIERPGDDRDVHPYTSARAAAREFQRAGFRMVDARAEWLEHRFTPEGYLDLLEHWIERELFEKLDADRRQRLRAAALHRMRDLGPTAFVWRRPLVSVTALAPSAPS